MTLHKNPKYQDPALIAAMQQHALEYDKPSQLADAFRLGWVAALAAAPAQAVPAPGEPSEAPHAELRKIWRKGQRWQTRGDPAGPWLDTTPCWHADREYRRHPDDAAVTTALLAAERESLQCDYCGAVTDDPWHSSGMLHGQLSRHIHSCDICAAQAQAQAQALTAAIAGMVYSRSMDLVRIFWQQHTQADALSMSMDELHADVERVIRAAIAAQQGEKHE